MIVTSSRQMNSESMSETPQTSMQPSSAKSMIA